MKTFVLILAMLAAPSPSTQISQTKAPTAAQQPQTVVKPTAKPAQPPLPQQPIVFTAKQLDEYENEILDRSETFYNNRMTDLLWIMGILVGIVAVIIPLVISVFMQWQRNISFKKELADVDTKLQKDIKKQTKELKTELIIAISSHLSMVFSGLGGVLSSQESEAAYDLMLQAHVLSMKFSIIGQCLGGCMSADQIIQTFSVTDKGKEVTLKTLEVVNTEIENMKGDLNEIVDEKMRLYKESQVKKLQIYVSALIHEKQQTTPTQAGP